MAYRGKYPNRIRQVWINTISEPGMCYFQTNDGTVYRFRATVEHHTLPRLGQVREEFPHAEEFKV